MRPPLRPGTFDHDCLVRGPTPRPHSPGGYRDEPYRDPYDPQGFAYGTGREALLSDDLLEDLAEERGIDLARQDMQEDMFRGQHPDPRFDGSLHGVWTGDYHDDRPSLLTESMPGGSAPTARELPQNADMDRWPLNRIRNVRENTFPGWNPSMPQGAVGYVEREEPFSWGHDSGPR